METRLKLFREETVEFKSELDELKDTLTAQNETIIKMLYEQQIELQIISSKVKKNVKKSKNLVKDFKALFPIRNQSELDNLESLINDTNIDEMAFTVRKILFPFGMRRNIKNILSTDIIMQYNLGGVQKKRFKNYEKILKVLFKSHSDPALSYSEFLKDFSSALQMHKNRQYKLASQKSKVQPNKDAELTSTTMKDDSCDTY